MNEEEIMVDIRGLSVNFYTQRGVVNAVRDLSFSIKKGETLALVGESGWGKTTAAKALVKLVPACGGEGICADQDLLVLLGVDIVGDHCHLKRAGERPAQPLHQRRLAAAHRARHAQPQRTLLF